MLSELTEKLGSKKFKLPLPIQEAVLTQVIADAQTIDPVNELPTDSRDPDDNNVLRIALFIKANFLITGDRDLLNLKKINDTEIISPSVFFCRYMA